MERGLLCTQFLIWSHTFLLRLSLGPSVPTVYWVNFTLVEWESNQQLPRVHYWEMKARAQAVFPRRGKKLKFHLSWVVKPVESVQISHKISPRLNWKRIKPKKSRGIPLTLWKYTKPKIIVVLSRAVKMRLFLPASRPLNFFFWRCQMLSCFGLPLKDFQTNH